MWIIQLWQIVYHWSNSHLRVKVLHNFDCVVFSLHLFIFKTRFNFFFPAFCYFVIFFIAKISQSSVFVSCHAFTISIYIFIHHNCLRNQRVLYDVKVQTCYVSNTESEHHIALNVAESKQALKFPMWRTFSTDHICTTHTIYKVALLNDVDEVTAHFQLFFFLFYFLYEKWPCKTGVLFLLFLDSQSTMRI